MPSCDTVSVPLPGLEVLIANGHLAYFFPYFLVSVPLPGLEVLIVLSNHSQLMGMGFSPVAGIRGFDRVLRK